MTDGRSDPGSLWDAVVERTRHALACGALSPIESEEERIDDAGVAFVVRWVSSLSRKAIHGARPQDAAARERATRVFPFDPDLVVRDIGDMHIAVLNKFSVIAHHLLIVTKRYVDQRALLTDLDFEALWRCMREYDSLGFYNGGAEAGASQAHKHLQVVPLPLGAGTAVPMEALFQPLRGRTGVQRVPGLPYRHGLAWLPDEPTGAALLNAYIALRTALSIEGADRNERLLQSAPYNLLLTRAWMLLVPRSREHFQGTSVNALGFAGSFFLPSEAQLAQVREVGPMGVLAAVAEPPDSGCG